MKKFKFTALIALALCMVMLLSSCTFFDLYKPKLKKVYQDGFTDETPNLTRAETVAVDGTVISSLGRLFYLRDTDGDTVHRVYDLTADRTAFMFTDTLTAQVTNVRLIAVGLSYVFAVTKTDTEDALHPVKTSLYSLGGAQLDSIDGNVTPTVAADLVQLDNKCYRVAENGEASELFTSGGLTKSLDQLGITECAGNYYHAVTANAVTIYDSTDGMKPCASWKAPSYTTSGPGFFVLNGGNVLIQYQSAAAEDTMFYTYLNDAGQKVNVTTLLLKAKNGKTSKRMTDFLFASVKHRDAVNNDGYQMRQSYVEKLTNIAVAAKIENRRVDISANGYGVYKLSDKGRVRGTLNATVTGQSAAIAAKVAVDRYDVTLKNGQHMLVDPAGKVIGEITGATHKTPSFIVAADKVYNYELTAIYDLKENDMQVVAVYDESIVLRKSGEDEWYLMTSNGQANYLAGAANGKSLTSSGSRFFKVRNNVSGQYEYYNEAGAVIITTQLNFSYEGGYRSCVLCSAYDTEAGKTVYYRFSAK